jgi:hypothetical protein
VREEKEKGIGIKKVGEHITTTMIVGKKHYKEICRKAYIRREKRGRGGKK